MKKINDNEYRVRDNLRIIRTGFSLWIAVDDKGFITKHIDPSFGRYLEDNKIADVEDLLLAEIEG